MRLKIRHIALFIILSSHLGYCQDFTRDCIYIDFETIPSGQLIDNMDIFDQYSDVFGVSFSLEGGIPARLAKVGAPMTAFQGPNNGADMPAAGVDIGQYFLTDNGTVFGLNADPIYVNFLSPMDSVSGCILDMDFGERFVVHALGEFGDVIFADTIFSSTVINGVIIPGDPGTGDGLCTEWGFRLDECEGSIFSVKLDGFRITNGGFGLGLDNLTFCKFGAKLNIDFQINQSDIICGGESGSIAVNSLSDQNLVYSLNGGDFSSELNFPEVAEGVYEITVRNELGCEDVYDISIDNIPVPEIISVIDTDAECGLENGTITLDVVGGFGEIQYTYDGQNYVTDGMFTDVPPGDYTIFVLDALGCVDSATATVAPSLGPTIIGVGQENASCDLSNGEITIGAIAATPFIEYSLNDGPWQMDSDFIDLAPGDYTITIRDEMGCTRDTMLTVEAYPIFEIRNVAETEPECLKDNGTITVTYDGGIGDIEYSIDGGFSYQFSNVFSGLAPGNYQILLKDEKGCELMVDAIVPRYVCPVYVGNIFAPNNNGANEFFPVITALEYPATILKYSIYDRWGELIYDAENFSIHDDSYYWDGNFRGKTAVLGVYVYLIQVGHLDGSTEYLSGDVTMIK
ncbi:MAG: gliding motility-associated C-terminal domain-containing protein [Saprospiraceae bacterium]